MPAEVDLRRAKVQRMCQRLPHAQLTFPFGDDVAVYKLAGRMFALVGLGESDQVSVKVDPDDGIALRAQHPTLEPGYHLNKRHWLTAHLGDPSISLGLLDEPITDSHALVHAALPRAVRATLID